MADYGIRKYRLGGALLERALLEGFTVEGNALQTDEMIHGVSSVFLPGLDSAQPDCGWGRLSLRCQLSPESMLTITSKWLIKANSSFIFNWPAMQVAEGYFFSQVERISTSFFPPPNRNIRRLG